MSSIFSKAGTGVGKFRTLTPSIDRKGFTGTFFTLYPAQARFLVPGDVWRETAKVLVRLQPLLSPNLTPMQIRVRWFYVPIRQIYPDLTELVITGSKDGVLYEQTLPEFDNVFAPIRADLETVDPPVKINVSEGSILNLMFGIRPGEYDRTAVAFSDAAASPAIYWLKAYCKIWWDYYRDENWTDTTIVSLEDSDLNFEIGDDFETFFENVSKLSNQLPCLPVLLPKNYITSALPWLLKGAIPTIEVSPFSQFNADYTQQVTTTQYADNGDVPLDVESAITEFDSTHDLYDVKYDDTSDAFTAGVASPYEDKSQDLQGAFEQIYGKAPDVAALEGTIQLSPTSQLGGGFSMQQLREMAAQTRIFERLARCGSRYTEYLRANFGISPADGTLQRPVYLGGFKQDILTTEVVQTAQDGDNPVGTLRGHGISYGGQNMKTFVNKEFGVLFALADVRPEIQFTQGVKREFTYKARFDFMNPSFQMLSEQEVRSGEVYFAGDGKNSETHGFQGMYNELRCGSNLMLGELGDNGAMQYWNQSISYDKRPELNGEFLNGRNYLADFLRPFGMADTSQNPIIFDFNFFNKPFRPLVKRPIPGLTDHN